MSSGKEIRDLNKIYLEAVYGGTPEKQEEPKDTRLLVTRADKKGNTPAYQKYKAGDKRYKAADHLKDDVEVEISSEVEKLIESGKFSDAEIAKIADIQEADIADIIARLEKKKNK